MSTKSLYSSIRNPEYTGENRCIPCTVVNVLIAAVISGLIALVSAPIAVASFALFVGAIYVRGYLVPGTPTLTQTYFPDRVLRWFDKESADFALTVNTGEDADVEVILQDVGVLEECNSRDDLCLTPDFEEEWYDAIDHFDEDVARQTLGRMLGISPDRISVLPRSRSFQVKVDDEVAGTWESSEAFVVDMATERVIEERVANWTDLSVEHRSGLLRGVRVYLERCPRCDGDVMISEETVKSCCRSRDVLASRCQDCGVRLFEIRAEEVSQPV